MTQGVPPLLARPEETPVAAPVQATAQLPDADPAQLTEAFKSGSLALQAGQRVGMRDPATGQIVTVPAEEAQTAVDAGGELVGDGALQRAILESKYGGVGGVAGAAGAGVARGLTLGGSDVALAELGGAEMRERLNAYQELHPVASIGGELVGAVAPSLIPGGAEVEGASLLARGARGLGALNEGVGLAGRAAEKLAVRVAGREAEGLAARVAQKAIAKGAEGAMMGAIYGMGGEASSMALSEEHLGSPGEVASKLFSAGAHGALLGGALGGVIGGGEELGKAALKGAAVKAQPFLSAKADESAFKTLNARKAFTDKAAEIPGGSRGIGRQLLNDGVIEAGDTVAEVAPKVARMRDKAGAAIDETFAKVAGNESVPLKDVLEKLETRAKEFDRKLGYEAAAAELRKTKERLTEMYLPRDAEEAFNASRALARDESMREGMRDLSSFRGAYEGATPAERDLIARGKIPGKNSSRPFEPIKMNMSDEGLYFQDGRHRLAAAQEAGASHISANIRTYDSLGNYTERLADVPIRAAEDAQVPLTDLLEQRRAFEKTVNFNTETVLAQGKKAAGRTLEDFVTEAADSLAKQKGMQTWAEEYKKAKLIYRRYALATEAAEDALVRSEANAGYSLTDKIHSAHGMLGAAAGIAAGHPTAALGLLAGPASKMVRTKGSSVAAVWLDKLSQLGRVEATASNVQKGIDRGIEGFFGKTRKNAAPFRTGPEVDVPQWQKAIAAYKTDPGGTVERVGRGADAVAAHAPKVAAEYGAVARRALAFLASKMPSPPVPKQAPVSFLPTRETRSNAAPPKLNPAAEAQFSRYARGVDLETVAADFAKGKLSYETLQTVKEVHPEVFARMQADVKDRLAKHKEDLSINQQIGLSILFETPLNWAGTPDGIKTLQKAIAINNAEEEQKKSQMGSGGGQNSGSAGDAAAEQTMLPFEAREMRGR